MDTKKINQFLKFWLPLILWSSVIFLFSSKPVHPASEIVWQDFVVKKTFHLIEYGLFFVLSYRAFLNTTKLNKKQSALASLLLVFFYGFSDEFHQSFTSGRQSRLRDVFIDGAGALLAWWFLWKYLPKMPARLTSWAKNLQII